MIIHRGEAYGVAKHSGDFRIYRRRGETQWHLEAMLWDDQYYRLDDVSPRDDWRDLLPEIGSRQASLKSAGAE